MNDDLYNLNEKPISRLSRLFWMAVQAVLILALPVVYLLSGGLSGAKNQQDALAAIIAPFLLMIPGILVAWYITGMYLAIYELCRFKIPGWVRKLRSSRPGD